MTADIIICGAGIAGISVAYHLAVRHGVRNILLVEEHSPLMLTSDKSTEAYRNWWPGPDETMVRFMDRSIDLLEELALESDNVFHLNRRGYVFLTADPAKIPAMCAAAEETSQLGAGDLRIHRGQPADPPYPPHLVEGFDPALTGADLVLDPAIIQQRFPFIAPDALAMIHPRRCGWLSAQQLGMYLLERAKACSVQLVNGKVQEVVVENGCVASVKINTNSTTSHVHTRTFVNAAGPLIRQVGQLVGADLPVFNELHGKVAINDPLGVIPRDAPLMIWEDRVALFWSDEEREDLASSDETRWLLEEFPAGVHFRPEGGPGSQTLLILWTYELQPREPVWPLRFPPELAEVALRGMVRMVPGLAAYLNNMGRPIIDGGYYCKTRENRPLIGPLPVQGAFLIGALSGYGIMASQAGAELLATYITGGELPGYAPAFQLGRYNNPNYQKLLAYWDATTGQL
jgi:glycine/D-amino acid oxidase-like deaminating enzyme